MVRSKSVREKVLAAALDLFAEKGFDRTSVQEITERAGVAKGGLYHHFAAKEDILMELYQPRFEQRQAELNSIIGLGKDPASTLRAVIESLVEQTAATAKIALMFTREADRLGAKRHEEIQAQWRQYQETVRSLIRDGQSAGVFRHEASPEVTSWAIFGVTNSLPTWYRPDGPMSPLQIATKLADLILAGLTADTAGLDGPPAG